MTIQEITVTEIQSAVRRGDQALLSLAGKLLNQCHPLPAEPVLAFMLRALRRGLLGASKPDYIEVSKKLVILLLRRNALSELLSEEFFTIFDIFVDIEDRYDDSIMKELVTMLKKGTELQQEYAMSAIWIFARHHEKIFDALHLTEAVNYLVAIARSEQEVLKDYALGTLMNLAEGTDAMKVVLQTAGVIELFLSEARSGSEIRKEYALEAIMHLTEGDQGLLDTLQHLNVDEVLVNAIKSGTAVQTEYAVEAITNFVARSEIFKCLLAENGAIEQLVHLARVGLRTALEAVCNFAGGNLIVHKSMLSSGAVDFLLKSLAVCNDAKDREDILWAIETLAASESEIKDELKAKCVINLLIPFIQSTSNVERDHAIGALFNLMAFDVLEDHSTIP